MQILLHMAFECHNFYIISIVLLRYLWTTVIFGCFEKAIVSNCTSSQLCWSLNPWDSPEIKKKKMSLCLWKACVKTTQVKKLHYFTKYHVKIVLFNTLLPVSVFGCSLCTAHHCNRWFVTTCWDFSESCVVNATTYKHWRTIYQMFMKCLSYARSRFALALRRAGK